MSTCQIKYMIADASTATEIQVSFIVSALEAVRTLDFTFLPVVFRKCASRYFIAMLAIRTMITGTE